MRGAEWRNPLRSRLEELGTVRLLSVASSSTSLRREVEGQVECLKELGDVIEIMH